MLYTAKTVFLEMGFERASMDEIAARAETSKRTLYAHFENKEKLYLAVIDLVRTMYLTKLKTPGEYSDDTTEALVLFCGRFLEGLLFAWTIRMCRLSISEADRFPEGSARYFDVVFNVAQGRLTEYLAEQFGLSDEASAEAAESLLARVIHPRFPRALFGVDAISYEFDEEAISPDFDLGPVRRAVGEMVRGLG